MARGGRRRRPETSLQLVVRLGAAASPPAQCLGPGAAVTARPEESARRAPFASVAQLLRRFWTRLQGLRPLLRILFTRRRDRANTGVVPFPVAPAPITRAPGASVPVVQPSRGGGGRGQAARHGVPRLHQDQDAAVVAAAKQQKARPVPPPPPAPLLEVNGEKVPMEQESKYKEYYRLTADCPDSYTLCHMCFFAEKCGDDGIVSKSGMFLHCCNIHKKRGLKCRVRGCYVRFGTERERELHLHFCHILP